MKNIKMFPYKMGSKSAKSISDFFGVKRLFLRGSYVYKKGDIIINWGNSIKPEFLKDFKDYNILNDFNSVGNSINKLKCLNILKEFNVPTVNFTTSIKEAKKLLQEGNIIYCRTLLKSRSGKGIVITNNEKELVNANLYTSYFKSTNEYRVHIFNGEVIDFQEKRKMSTEKLLLNNISEEKRTDKIRNHDSGWCFCRKDINCPDTIKEIALNAIKALNLTFGACDILYNSNTKKIALLEINTAPGLDSGTETHRNYCRNFSKYLDIPFSEENYNELYKK